MPTSDTSRPDSPWRPPRCRCNPSFTCARPRDTRYCSLKAGEFSGFAAKLRLSGRSPEDGMQVPTRPRLGKIGPSLSEILIQIAQDETRRRISVRDLLVALRARAIGALIFVFALPNIIPLPPGASSILGAPLLFLTAQLALGLKPWLPSVIADRSMDRMHFAAAVRRIAPWLARAERLLRPRVETLARPPFEYLIGAICLLLSIILFLPIPMGNMPPAIAICLFALAILERDGIWVLAGLCATMAPVAIVWGVLFARFRSALFLLERLLDLAQPRTWRRKDLPPGRLTHI